jgi:hypothetical protein
MELIAGTRYPTAVEHYQDGERAAAICVDECESSGNTFLPSPFATAPPQILSDRRAVAEGWAGSQLSDRRQRLADELWRVNPAGWTINTATGRLPAAEYRGAGLSLTATNAVGSGSAILNLEIISTGAMITRDVWTGVPGTAVSAIPLDTNPTTTGNISTLEGPQNSADDYGARIRGYITAPLTGVYKFFIAASDTAELWISNDDDPVNIFNRAQVLAPTNYREWTNANAGKSPLLQLFAGKRYYVEVRHKAGVGSDHVSVGWLKPGEGLPNPAAATAPWRSSRVTLSPYVPLTIVPGEALHHELVRRSGRDEQWLWRRVAAPECG